MTSLAQHLLLFTGCAAIVWWAGTKLELYSDLIAERTNLGKALAGTLLLAIATSLPELVTSITATAIGDIDMAVHNLLGGVIFQTAILAFADLAMRRRSITFAAPEFPLLLQGLGLILILCSTIVIFLFSAFFPHNVGPRMMNGAFFLLPLIYFFVLRSMHKGAHTPHWKPLKHVSFATECGGKLERGKPEWTLQLLYSRFSALSILVLATGWQLTVSAEVIGSATGLGSSFIGATALAVATSLPEVSTVFASVRSGNPETAIANVFGSNCFDTVLLSVVALLATKCIACTFSPSAVFAAALGSILTGIYLWGLLERENKTIAGMGYDSIAIICLCFFGFWTLYVLR